MSLLDITNVWFSKEFTWVETIPLFNVNFIFHYNFREQLNVRKSTNWEGRMEKESKSDNDTKKQKSKRNWFKKDKKNNTSTDEKEASVSENRTECPRPVRKTDSPGSIQRKIGMAEKHEVEREKIKNELKEIIRNERLNEIELF